MSTTRRKLTVPAVAEQLGVAQKKVLDWIRAGELRRNQPGSPSRQPAPIRNRSRGPSRVRAISARNSRGDATTTEIGQTFERLFRLTKKPGIAGWHFASTGQIGVSNMDTIQNRPSPPPSLSHLPTDVQIVEAALKRLIAIARPAVTRDLADPETRICYHLMRARAIAREAIGRAEQCLQ